MLSPSFSSLTERFVFHFAHTQQKAGIRFWMHAGSFQKLTLGRASLIRLAFDPRERQIPIGIDRVDPFVTLSFDQNEIPFVKTIQFFIDLIADPSFALLREAMKLLARLSGAKVNRIHVALRWSDNFTCEQGSNA